MLAAEEEKFLVLDLISQFLQCLKVPSNGREA